MRTTTPAKQPGGPATAGSALARRAGLVDAIARWSNRTQTVELTKLVVIPGSVLVVGGFLVMFFGWYGAARTYPDVAQIPYLISGGFIGLGLVVLGGLLLGSAVWIAQLGRVQRSIQEGLDHRIEELAATIRAMGASQTPNGKAQAQRAAPHRSRSTEVGGP